MAIDWFGGGETGHPVSEGLSIGGGTVVSGSTTPRAVNGRGGTRYFTCQSTGSNTASFVRLDRTGPTSAVQVKMHFRVDSLPSSDVYIIQITDGSTNIGTCVKLKTTGRLAIFNAASTQIGADSTVTVSTNTWYTVLLVQNGTTATLYAAVDDGSAVTQQVTGACTSRTDLHTTFIGWANAPGATKNMDIDDMVRDNAATTLLDTDSVIFWHQSLSDNARTGWTVGGGGTTNLFAAVDNVPPVGVIDASATSTSQIRDANNNATDNYDANVESYSTKGVLNLDVILATQPYATVGSSSATGVNQAVEGVSNPVAASVTTTGGISAVGTFPSGWVPAPGTLVAAPSVTSGTSPVVRVGRRTASANIAECCSLGLSSLVLLSRATSPVSRTYCQAVMRASNW